MLAALERRCKTRESFSRAFAEELGRGVEWCDKGADPNHPPLPWHFLAFGSYIDTSPEERLLKAALEAIWDDGLDDALGTMNELHARLQPPTPPKEATDA